LTDIPDVVAKLCSPHPLSFADLAAAYGSANTAATPAGAASTADGAAGMLSYLQAHGVTAKLNAAVNALAASKPADPMAFLIAELQKK